MIDVANDIINASNLQALEQKIREYMAATPTGSKADDWLDGELNEFLKDYRHKHFNFSAKWELGYYPNIKNGNRKRFIYRA